MRTSKLSKLFFAPLFVCMFACSLPAKPANAQLAGATLSGQIADASHGSLPGAVVTVRNNANGAIRTINANGSGLYSISDLPPGLYSVTVTAPGFSAFSEKNVQLNVGITRDLDVSMIIGGVDQTVTVVAGSNDVETDTSVVSATVGQKRIEELPLNGRDWTQLATLQPGVNNVRTQASTSAISSNRATRGFGNALTANGHSPYENTYRIDGINENDYANGAPGSPAGVNLGVDAIQEFSVVTTAYTAEYGRTSGAVINAVTKSGSNEVHGTVYFFDRDKIFDAKNPFDSTSLPIPSFHRGQFGAAVGGPIRKDKSFLFGNYEGLRQAQSLNLNLNVPSVNARNGMVHNTAGTAQTIAISPLIVPYLRLFPTPNTATTSSFGDLGLYSTTGLVTITEDFATARFDQTLSAKDNLSATFVYDNAPSTLPDSYVNILNQNFDQRDLGALSERHIFGANVLNVLRIGYNRNNGLSNIPLKALNPAAADTTLGYSSTQNAPQITISGLTSIGGIGAARQGIFYGNSYQLNDDLAFVLGRHNLKVGFAAERVQESGTDPVPNGTASFVSTGTNTALTNFFLDTVRSVQIPPLTSNPFETVVNLFGGYVQDDWRISRQLSLNLGLRYEMTMLPYDKKGRIGLINTLTAPAGTGPCPTVIQATNVPGCTVPVAHYMQTNPTLHNFEPRIGFSYDVFGNGSTALRGAFGIYDYLPLPFLFQYAAISAPFSQDRVGINVVPTGAFPGGVNTIVNGLPNSRIGHYIDPNPKRDYSLNYNLNIEQRFSKTVAGTIGYVGSHSVHNPFQTQDVNIVAPSRVRVIGQNYIFPNAAAVVQDQNNGQIFGHFWDGSSHYSGLLTQLKVSGFHGLVTQGTYTWQKCIDYGPTQSPGTYTNTVTSLLYYDKTQRRGACDYVLTQNFSENTLYELPSPLKGFLRSVLGGFQVGGIVNVSTGSQFTILNSGDVIGQGGFVTSSFPNFQQGCNPYVSNFKVGKRYLNANCFSYPAVDPSSAIAPLCKTNGITLASGQVYCANLQGNERRNGLVGPRLVDTDVSLIKNTRLPRLSEAANLQLRVEAFNVLNHANYQAPTDALTLGGVGAAGTNAAALGTAGTLTSTATPSRQIQLGAKIIF